MRIKAIIFSLLALALAVSPAVADYNSTIGALSNKKARWKLDEASGTVTDSVGTHNSTSVSNATQGAAPLVSDNGKAVTITGTNPGASVIVVPSSTDFQPGAGTAMSFIAWFKISDTSNTCFFFGGTTLGNLGIGTVAGFFCVDTGGAGSGNNHYSPTAAWGDGNKHLAVVSRDASNNWSVFLDGASTATYTFSTTDAANITTNVLIGNGSGSNPGWSGGTLDDIVYINGTALTGTDSANIWSAGTTVSSSSSASPGTLPSNHNGDITVSITGTGTAYTSSTTWTVAGVSGWTKASQAFADATHFTVVLTPPAAASPPAGSTGTLTLTEGVTGTTTASITISTPTLAISPTSGLSGGTVSLTLTGNAQIWSTETAAGLFTESGGTGASIGTPTVTTNTAASATLTKGSASGALTITDASTGAYTTFTVTSGTIAITTPVAQEVFQRTGDTNGLGGTGNIVIVGTYTGSPVAIEASFGGGSYAMIANGSGTGTMSGGNFTGTLSGQVAGQGTLTCRFANDTSVTATAATIGIGDVWICSGQSNMSGRGANNQLVSVAGSITASLFSNNYSTFSTAWQVLTDPYDDSTSQTDTVSSDGATGSMVPILATHLIAYTRVPQAFIPTSRGGTSITAWLPSTNHLDRTTLYGSQNYRAQNAGTGGVRGVLWWQGETDAQNGMSQATYHSNLSSYIAAVWSDIGAPVIACKLQTYDAGTVPQSNQNAINAAIAQGYSDIPHLLKGPDFSDLQTMPGDTFHFISNAQEQVSGSRWWDAIYQAMYQPASTGGGGGSTTGSPSSGRIGIGFFKKKEEPAWKRAA